jgi:hypothetical protein
MINVKYLSAASILAKVILTPVLAQAVISEPSAHASYHLNGNPAPRGKGGAYATMAPAPQRAQIVKPEQDEFYLMGR